MPGILTVVYLAALCLLLWVAHKNKGAYAAAKGLCSALFLLCALLVRTRGGGPLAEFLLLFSALALCAFGDVLLGVANRTAGRVSKKPFLAGALSFGGAHLVFCILFSLRAPFSPWDVLPPAAMAGVLYVLEKRGLVRLKKMRPLGYAYTILVSLMTVKAAGWYFAYGQQQAAAAVFVLVGAVLFMLSDVILLFLYFGVKRQKWLRPANLITYYAGVWLLALGSQVI